MSRFRNLVEMFIDKKGIDQFGMHYIKNSKEEEFISFGELYNNSLKILGFLQAKGIERGEELIFQIEENKDFIHIFWAALMGGIIPVPLAKGINEEHRKKVFNVIKKLNNPYIICEEKQQELLKKIANEKKLNTEVITHKCIFIKDVYEYETLGNIEDITEDDIAFIQFSSGSTGDPKGVVLSHYNLINNIYDIVDTANITTEDILITWMPLTHDMGLIGCHLVPTLMNINQYSINVNLFIRRPSLWIEKASEHKASLMESPNFGFSYLLNYIKKNPIQKLNLSNVRIIFNGAEPISIEICNEFLNEMEKYSMKSNVMYPVYGLAEASLAVTFPNINEEKVFTVIIDRRCLGIGNKVIFINDMDSENASEFVELGSVVQNCELRICDNDNEILNDGTIGHIQIRGKNISRGYYNDVKKTIDTWTNDGWFKTGDVGFQYNNRLVVLGRIKNIIFINGQNYYSEDLEKAAIQVPKVELGKVAVTSIRVHKLQKEVIVIFLRYNSDLENFVKISQQLKAHFLKNLSIEIFEVIPVRAIPKTTSGKIQRFILAKKYENGEFEKVKNDINEIVHRKELMQNELMNIQFETSLEKQLLSIIKEIIEQKNVSIDTSYFEMGMDSLKATYFVAQINQRFKRNISVRVIFECGNIRKLGNYLETLDEKENIIKKITPKTSYSLSFSQKRIYLQSLYNGVDTSYNIPVIMNIKGTINFRKFNHALQTIMQRHDILRCSFDLVGNDIVQKLDNDVSIELEVIKTSVHEKRDLVYSLIQPFDISKAPLIRIKLIQTPEEQILFMDVHHLICDGKSMEIFMSEFCDLYNNKELKVLQIQYFDYAAWNNNAVNKEFQKEYEFWKQELQETLPVLNLPLDHIRKNYRTFVGGKVQFIIDETCTKKLFDYTKEGQVVLNSILFTIYADLLSFYTNQDEVVVGSLISGRNNAAIHDLIGVFTNYLPVRIQLDKEKSVKEQIKEVNKHLVDIYENSNIPYEKIIDISDAPIDITRNPLFDTMLILHNEFDVGKKLFTDDFALEKFDLLNNNNAKLDIRIDVFIMNNLLEFKIEYNSNLFYQSTMERFAKHFSELIHSYSNNLNEKIKNINVLDAFETQVITDKFNNTYYNYDNSKTLEMIFLEQVNKTPNQEAVIVGDKKYTYKEVNHLANCLAGKLRRYRVRVGDIVALMVKRGIEMIVGIIAIHKLGAAYMPIDLNIPKNRLEFILNDSKAKLLLTNCLTEVKGASIIDFEVNNDKEEPIEVSKHSDRNLAYVIYTSGSTGNPKGVMIEHRSVVNRIMWMQKEYPISNSDVILQKTPYTFDVSVWELVWWYFAGAKVVMLEPDGEKDPSKILSSIHQENITVMHFVPTMLNSFLGYIESVNTNFSTSKLKYVFASGEALNVEHINKFNRDIRQYCNAELHNLYGPTEAAIDVSYFDCSMLGDRNTVPIGEPIDNNKIYILDKYCRMKPIGIIGELVIEGIGVARGYLNNQELTNQKFVDSPFNKDERMYRTGDLARWLPDGYIEFLGRSDFQVKIRGLRIEVGEIEALIRKYPDVLNTVVMKFEDVNRDGFLCGYIETKHNISEDEMRKFLLSKMPSYMVPACFVFLDSFPVSKNGKIKIDNLPKPSFEYKRNQVKKEAVNQEQKDILVALEDILPIKNIGIDDNFFTLGGDSIKVIKLVTELKKQGYSINIGDVFIYATAEQLSGHIFKESNNNIENKKNRMLNLDYLDNAYVNYVFENFDYEELVEEKKYWNKIDKIPNLSLFQNKNCELSSGIKSKTFYLEQETFNLIVNQINAEFGTSLNEVIISILGLTINKYYELSKYRILIEEAIHNSVAGLEDKISIFYLYPLCLSGEKQYTECQYLRLTKEEIRRIPNNGLGYFLSLGLDDDIINKKELFNSDILYRYMTNSNKNISSSFKNIQYQDKLLIDVAEVGRGIEVKIMYNSHIYSDLYVEDFIQTYLDNTSKLLLSCLNAENQKYTPSDIGNYTIDMEEFDVVLNEISMLNLPEDKIED